jgi:hypothetical protein
MLPAVTNTMSSRALPFAVLIFAGIFFWAWVALAGAGGGLTDPAQILTEGAQATADADSFHVSVTVEGSMTDASTGQPLSLDGVSVEGDVDLAGSAGHVTFSLPMLFGMSGEVIAIGQDVWVLTPMAGDQWIHVTNTEEDGPEPSDEPSAEDIAAKIDELLATEGVSLTKLADQPCGDDTCYHLQLSVSAEAMAAHGDGVPEVPGMEGFGGGLPNPELSGPAVVDLLFQQDGLWLREVSMTSEGEDGTASMAVELSDYNASFDINPPPADQVIEGEDIPLFQ